MGNLITVLTVTYVVYFMMALAIFRSETIGDRKLIPEGNLQVKSLTKVGLYWIDWLTQHCVGKASPAHACNGALLYMGLYSA